MTQNPTNPIFAIIDEVVSFAGRNLNGNPFDGDAGHHYKKASDLSAGDVLVLPSGTEATVRSVALVDGDDNTLEVELLNNNDTQYFWKNLKVQVK